MSLSSTRTVIARPIAQRTCVACRQIKAKRELVRLVRAPEGNIEIDDSGKKKGRGAYLCAARECWEKALQGNKLERALRARLTRDNRAQLIQSCQGLRKGV